MDLVEVDVIGAQILKAYVNVRSHGFLGAGHALGGDDEMLSDALQGIAQVFFTDGVATGSVDEVHTGILQLVHQGLGALGIDLLDGDTAEADAGDFQTGFT